MGLKSVIRPILEAFFVFYAPENGGGHVRFVKIHVFKFGRGVYRQPDRTYVCRIGIAFVRTVPYTYYVHTYVYTYVSNRIKWCTYVVYVRYVQSIRWNQKMQNHQHELLALQIYSINYEANLLRDLFTLLAWKYFWS